MATLPPRLSDQQQFILAYLANRKGRMPPAYLSRSVAHEFGRLDDEKHARTASGTGWSRSNTTPGVTDEHAASFSRAVTRLEDRGLVRRLDVDEVRENSITGIAHMEEVWVVALTDDGREAGKELVRQHEDGRCSLEFETLDEDPMSDHFWHGRHY